MLEDVSIEDAAHGAERWRMAVREFPESAAARYALGVALVRSGLEEEAGAAFREAAALRPGWAEARNALGAVLFRQGRHDEAIDALSVASRLGGNISLPWINLGMAYALCRWYSEAADAWRDVIRRDPARPGFHAKLGWALCRLGEHREAAGAFRDAV